MELYKGRSDGRFEMISNWTISCLICGAETVIDRDSLNIAVDDQYSHCCDGQYAKEHYFWQEYYCTSCSEKHFVRVKAYENHDGELIKTVFDDNDEDDFLEEPSLFVHPVPRVDTPSIEEKRSEGDHPMAQKDLRTYQRRGVTRESGYHTCEETTGGECVVSFAQQYECIEESTNFLFGRKELELTELFEKGIAIIAFGGYLHASEKANIGIEICYKYEDGVVNVYDSFDTVIEPNSWKNIGFHVEQTINKDNRIHDVLVRLTVNTIPGAVLNFISFDMDTIHKDEFADTSCAKSFYQKTSMHVPYLYYLESELPITQYLLDKYCFEKGLRVILKSCNRCGRFLPINIDNEMRTLSFSLHCKKRAPCVHSTFRAYEIQNADKLTSDDLIGLQIEDNKVISYFGHQLECKACKKFFVNAPLNPQRNAQQFKEDGLRRRAIEVLVNTLLDRNLVHFEFEKRTKKEFSKYIWAKFDKRCFKCGPKSDPIELEDMALDHTLPLAYLYRLDESATCLCSSHNSQKSDHFPVDYYSEEELIRLSSITGLTIEQLRTKKVNQKVLDLLIERVVWFYDEFLMEPDYQKKRDGIRTADKINDSLKRIIAGQVDLAEEYRRITGKYPTSVTIR